MIKISTALLQKYTEIFLLVVAFLDITTEYGYEFSCDTDM